MNILKSYRTKKSVRQNKIITSCPPRGTGGISRIILLALLLFLPGGGLFAERIAVPGTIAVCPVQDSGLQLNALSRKSADSVRDVFDRLGRFLPVDGDRVQSAMDAMPQGSGDEALIKAARELGADLYAVISVSLESGTVIGTIAIRPVSPSYGRLQQDITVRSKVLMNIPLKLARETALLHKDMAIEAHVVETREGLSILDAGQWHGLAPGRYRTGSGATIDIRNTGRHRSLATLPKGMSPSFPITIKVYPPYRAVVRELTKQIDYNTNAKYSLAATGVQGQDPEKKFTLGMCLVNPGANACLPGYGSYLSTSYLGFKNTSPSIGGIVFSSLLIVTHFILPEAMTKFKINFVPGIMDSDKTEAMNNLQIFCWATVPLTVSVAYLDQLAYQFKVNSALPPFFMNRNETALALSLFIPGGGMFYKGYRLPGWGFYLSEMFLAGFCVNTKNDKKKVLYGGIALGGLKVIELITAYFSPPAFSFFKFEQEGRINQASLSMKIDSTETGDLVYKLGISCNF